MIRRICAIILVVGLSGCNDVPPTATAPSAEPSLAVEVLSPTPDPTPTPFPTVVPGSAADYEEATAVVQEFADALVRDDELVALLVLSPSAQQTVASSSLDRFLGRAEQPRDLDIGMVRLERDVATADCTVSYAGQTLPVRLRLVRLNGQWKIDAREDL